MGSTLGPLILHFYMANFGKKIFDKSTINDIIEVKIQKRNAF